MPSPFARAFDFAPIGYLILEPGGRISDLNKAACAALGRAREALLGTNLGSLFADPGTSLAAFLSQQSQAGYVEQAPLELLHQDGSRRETLVNARTEPDRVLLTFIDVTERNQLSRERDRLVEELKGALEQIRTLTGILPICAHCKRIRTDAGEWQPIESYLRDRTLAKFSHGICPGCLQVLYPEL